MTLIVAPADGFDSYITTDQADTYIADMGRKGWPDDKGAKEAALRQATQYIRLRYAPQEQYIDPPHKNLIAATTEAALRTDKLFTDVDPRAVMQQTVGPLSTTYADPVNGGQVRFALIDALMAGIGADARSGVFMLKRV
ncbi:DnaT-like ssDNA-binding protein [Castellaniella sp.]|uniref:DnaT-like ssDNA-binding protein n=1 Tax=Castellaniella sp. TaxID=1955812 RepID=UPI00355FD573